MVQNYAVRLQSHVCVSVFAKTLLHGKQFFNSKLKCGKVNKLKGNGGLGGHVMKIGHFGLKKFLDPDLVCRISVILITSGAKTLEKIV